MLKRVLVIGGIAIAVVIVASGCSSSDPATDTGDGGASSSSGGTSSSSSSSGGTSSSSSSSSGDGGSTAPATHTDGTKNLDETDVDCGGAATDASGKAKRCDVGKGCKVGDDCTSAACRYDGKCVAPLEKSCIAHHGGDTCGAVDKQESCCNAIDIPNGPDGAYKLDKYMITAGRFRAFVDATKGDIRGWLTTNKPANWDQDDNDNVPNKLNDTGEYISHDGVYQELGPGTHFADNGGNQGCTVETNGARTYFVPDADSKSLWGETNHYSQDDLDEKALNCVTFYMLSAFCAWDGGRLPTLAELDFAWDGGDPAGHTYPWGTEPAPAGFGDSFNNRQEATDSSPVTPAGGDQTFASFLFNWWSPADRKCAPDESWCDYSVHVAPPGRFPKGNGPFGHADLAGNLFNITSTPTTGPNNNPADPNNSVNWSRNGSWEGHGIPYPTTTGFDRFSKYLATGGRCARD